MDAVYFTLFIFLYQLVFGFPSYSFRIPHPHKIHIIFRFFFSAKTEILTINCALCIMHYAFLYFPGCTFSSLSLYFQVALCYNLL